MLLAQPAPDDLLALRGNKLIGSWFGTGSSRERSALLPKTNAEVGGITRSEGPTDAPDQHELIQSTYGVLDLQ